MAVILDDAGGVDVFGDGSSPDATAPFTFRLSEPTLHAFSPDLVEDAQRNTYQADISGVVYSLLLTGEVYKNMAANASLVATVAGQLAATWDANAAVPGVADIVETQEVSPLGSLDDVYQVAVQSTSGRSTLILALTNQQIRPDVFAQIVATNVAALDTLEQGG